MERDLAGDLHDAADETTQSFEHDARASSQADDKLTSGPALLIAQGKRQFYSMSLPSKLLAGSCAVESRAENPIDGFQRLLDKKRARNIAHYIDAGFGAVPSAIILSAQPRAHLHFDKKTGLLSFHNDPRAFLVIDGQHRVFGFSLAKKTVHAPVVIFNKLTRAEECQLFMDINTKQRRVPAELLLDIRSLSQEETAKDALLRQVFDAFHTREDSALRDFVSPSQRKKGAITRVTFNAALKSIDGAFEGSSCDDVYAVLNAYYAACYKGLRLLDAQENFVNPVLFKALTQLFADVAARVADRYNGKYTVKNFEEVVLPCLRRMRKSELPKPKETHLATYESLRKSMTAGFLLKPWFFL